MTDREKVIKGLEYHLKELTVGKTCFECPYCGDNPCEINLIANAIAILKEQDASEWISVKDKMPEEAVPVLVWEQQGFAYVDIYKGGVWGIGTPNLAKITHWMSIHEPPKEVSE